MLLVAVPLTSHAAAAAAAAASVMNLAVLPFCCCQLPNSFDAPRVVKAFLTHDLPTLRKHCGPELMERLEGIFKHFEAQVCHFNL
jgi:hypothetical protein